MAEENIEDARALLVSGRWGCAYYIAGYAVECALKACILLRVENTGIIFDDPRFLAGCRTHELEALVKIAGIEKSFGIAQGGNPNLQRFWNKTKLWTEESRYDRKTQGEAEELFEAITNNPDGVLTWIRTCW